MLGAAVVAVVVAAGVDAWRVRNDLHRGAAELSALRGIAAWDDGGSAADAARGRRDLQAAHSVADHSRWLAALAIVPGVHGQVAALRDLTARADRVGTIADDETRRLLTAVSGPASDGPARLLRLDAVAAALQRAAADLSRVPARRRGTLVGPLASLRRRVDGATARARVELPKAAQSVAALQALLRGPRRYLVLAANNAEMRGAGGMALQAGVLEIAGGSISMGGFRSTRELVLDQPVPVPPQLAADFGWLEPGREWRNTGSSANFPAIAPVYAAMAGRAGFGSVDGVLQVDAVALARLLAVVGAVDVDGQHYTAQNAERLVLHDLYARFGDAVDGRHAAMASLARATLGRVDAGGWSPVRLAGELAGLAPGRHLLAWSSRAAEQRAWVQLRLDGGLRADGLLLSVQNQSANKLDWFVAPAATVATEAHGRATRITVHLSIPNSRPPGQAPYVLGPGVDGIAPGDYRTLTAFYLPADAANVTVRGAQTVAVGADGPMRLVAARLVVPDGATRRVDVTFWLRGRHRRLTVIPGGRAQPTQLDFAGRHSDDARPRVLQW